MATVHHNNHPQMPSLGDDKLRHDRHVAIIVLAVMAALMALIIWLASLGGGPVEPIEYWELMP